MPRRIDAYEQYPCVMHAWDNSPRSGRNALVLHRATPELFRTLLRRAIEVREDKPAEERFVFLKAWNEWAEGNHLEPDQAFGDGFLRVIREELDAANGSAPRADA